MYCSNCGKELGNHKVCEDCNPKIETQKSLKNCLKYGLLSFIFPLSAIVIIYIIGKKDQALVKYFKIGSIISIIFISVYLIPYLKSIIYYISILIALILGTFMKT